MSDGDNSEDDDDPNPDDDDYDLENDKVYQYFKEQERKNQSVPFIASKGKIGSPVKTTETS